MEHAVAGMVAQYSYPAVFLLLVSCGLGAPLSEEAITVLGGVMVGRAGHAVGWMMAVAFAGQVAGDSIIYFLGRQLGPRAMKLARFRRLLTPRRMQWVERHFHRRGMLTVFGVRFIPGARAPAFLLAGVGRQSRAKFLAADSAAALITAPALTYLGYHFGAHVLKGLKVATASIVGAGAVVLVVTLGLTLWRRRRGPPSSGSRSAFRRHPAGA